MDSVNSELKSVTESTSFRAVRVFDKGSEKYALIDQDSQIVGFTNRELPYFIKSFSEALTAADRGLRNGACYRGYPCSPFGQHHYVIEQVFEPVTEFSDIPEVMEAEELLNASIALLNQIKSQKEDNSQALPNEKIINVV